MPGRYMAEDWYLALFLISFLLLVVGLLRPKTFVPVFRSLATRGKLSLLFGGALVVFFVLFGISVPPQGSTKPEAAQPSTAEQETATVKISQTVQYRSVPGFTLLNELEVQGAEQYFYEPAGGRYRVELVVTPPGPLDDFDLADERYVLGRNSRTIRDIEVAAAFQNETVINGTKVADAYQKAAFTFMRDGRRHVGYVYRADNTPDQAGLEKTLQSFTAALLGP